MTNLRIEALEWWYEILGCQYPIIVKHKEVITGGEHRHPVTLTGREIEDLYKAEHKESTSDETQVSGI